MPRFDVDNYISVQDRINKFWSDYPNGRIRTELHQLSTLEEVIVIAEVWKDGTSATDPDGYRAYRNPDVSGMAQEKKGTGGANNTSWLENAETSAIGRALANLGYATSQADRPSAEEMEKVNRATPAARPTPVSTSRPAPEGEDETARKRLMTAVILSTKQKGIADEDRKALSLSRFGKESWTELTMAELETMKGWIARHDRKRWMEEVVPVLKDMIDAASTDDFDAIGSTVMALDLAGDDDLVAAGTSLKAKLVEVAA